MTYTYDNDGNMITATTSSGTTTYTYDYENRLTSVDVNGTMVATYTYDALGRRIGIKDSGTQTWTVYDGASADANGYADFNGSGNVTVRYLSVSQDPRPGIPNQASDPGAALSHYSALMASGMPEEQAMEQFLQAAQGNPSFVVPLARTSSAGTTAWYLTDQVGSVRYIESTSGTVLDEISYDAFGNIVSQSGSSYADRFLFAGMQYDATAGIYYDHGAIMIRPSGGSRPRIPRGSRRGMRTCTGMSLTIRSAQPIRAD